MSEGAAVGWDAAEVAAWATEGGFDGALFEENEIDGGTLFELDVEVRIPVARALQVAESFHFAPTLTP